MTPIKGNFAGILVLTLSYFIQSSASYNPHRAGTDVHLFHQHSYFRLCPIMPDSML